MKKFRVIVNGNEYMVEIEELAEELKTVATQSSPAPAPEPAPPRPAPQQTVKAPVAPESAVSGGSIIAPIPGTVIDIMVNVGDQVTQGQSLLVLEAMKMENEIVATSDGKVLEINAIKGASVNAGDTLIVLSS